MMTMMTMEMPLQSEHPVDITTAQQPLSFLCHKVHHDGHFFFEIGWPLVDHDHRDYQEDDQDGTVHGDGDGSCLALFSLWQLSWWDGRWEEWCLAWRTQWSSSCTLVHSFFIHDHCSLGCTYNVNKCSKRCIHRTVTSGSLIRVWFKSKAPPEKKVFPLSTYLGSLIRN